jgi:hypothetical protein
MLREQAVAFMKELVANNLIQTSWVSIEERTPNSYELKFKGSCDRSLIYPILQKHNLTIKEDKDKGYLVIFET